MKKEWSLPGRACWILCLTVAIAMVQVQEVRSQTTTQRMTRLTLVEQNTPFGTVSLIAPVGAGSYQLTMPASAPGQGSLLYLSNGSGQLAWTTAPAANQVLTTNGSGQPTWVANSTFLGNTWSITGNTGMDTSAQYIGTTDALPIIVRTNGTERWSGSSVQAAAAAQRRPGEPAPASRRRTARPKPERGRGQRWSPSPQFFPARKRGNPTSVRSSDGA